MIIITSNTNWITILHDNSTDYFKSEKIRISSIFKYDRHSDDACVMLQYGSNYISVGCDDITSINGNTDLNTNQKLYDAFDNIIDPQP